MYVIRVCQKTGARNNYIVIIITKNNETVAFAVLRVSRSLKNWSGTQGYKTYIVTLRHPALMHPVLIALYGALGS